MDSVDDRRLLGSALLECLQCCDAVEKVSLTKALGAQWAARHLRPEYGDSVPLDLDQPGLPNNLQLVPPRQVPMRALGSEQGRIGLLHAVAHIEFNAINLALDAAYRFRDFPEAYYDDWISVAVDEARHFEMLADRLSAYGATYGDLPAHNGLWEMACATRHDRLHRMALVPRVLEARGLDVTPGMIKRVQSIGDLETVAVLKIILQEEERHVEIGTRWFNWCCQSAGVEPQSTFLGLIEEHYGGKMKAPFNEPARMRAGFTENEMQAIKRLAQR